jgi:hypothetical protein
MPAQSKLVTILSKVFEHVVVYVDKFFVMKIL